MRKFWKQPFDFSSDGCSGIFLFLGDRVHGNHHIGFHLDERTRNLFFDPAPKLTLNSKISSVCHKNCCILRKLPSANLRGVMDHHKTDSFFGKLSFYFQKPLHHELIVTQCCIREVVHESKIHHKRKRKAF